MIKKPIPLEKVIQKQICEYLDKFKYFFWRSNNIPVFGMNNGGKKAFRSLPKHTPRGLPDIIVIYKGKFIALEVKRQGAKLRPEQAEFGTKCTLHGGFYYKVESLTQVQDILSSLT